MSDGKFILIIYSTKKSYQTRQSQSKNHDEVGLKSAKTITSVLLWAWYEQREMKTDNCQDGW